MPGTVLQTNKYLEGDNSIPFCNSVGVRAGMYFPEGSTYNALFRSPYIGLGFDRLSLSDSKHDLGSPFSLYLLQGATLARFCDRLTMNYEWNLGISLNWHYFNTFNNPRNLVIGSASNIHISGKIYFNWMLSQRLDLTLGGGFSHYSNGAYQIPNAGINILHGSIGMNYHFNPANRAPMKIREHMELERPYVKKRWAHDIAMLISSRQVKVDTTGTDLASPYNDSNYRVWGMSYALMRVCNTCYAWGPSAEVTYSEGIGLRVRRDIDPTTGNYVDGYQLAPFRDRLMLSLSMKGEMQMPKFTMFAQLGYDVIHSKRDTEPRFYQIVGTKFFLSGNMFATFGIRAVNCSAAQYLYWTIGYRL